MFPFLSASIVTLLTCLNGFSKVFCQIWEMEITNLDLGMVLLHAVKELRLNVSRTSLDFLLSACVKSKNSQRAQQIWSEYESAGLLHNVLTSLRLDHNSTFTG
jgi:hypothetical protein